MVSGAGELYYATLTGDLFRFFILSTAFILIKLNMLYNRNASLHNAVHFFSCSSL